MTLNTTQTRDSLDSRIRAQQDLDARVCRRMTPEEALQIKGIYEIVEAFHEALRVKKTASPLAIPPEMEGSTSSALVNPTIVVHPPVERVVFQLPGRSSLKTSP